MPEKILNTCFYDDGVLDSNAIMLESAVKDSGALLRWSSRVEDSLADTGAIYWEQANKVNQPGQATLSKFTEISRPPEAA